MKFSERDRRSLQNEFEELRIPQSKMANVVGISGGCLSEILSGLRQPTEQQLRRMACVFAVVRAANMESGGFKLDVKGLNLLRRKLDEMERNAVLSARKQPNDDEAGEEPRCRQAAN